MRECHAGRAGMGGPGYGRCLVPCPLNPSLAEGPCRGRFGFVQGLLPQPCCGEAPGPGTTTPGSARPWLRAVCWEVLALALPHSLTLQNTSTPLPELPGADWGRSQQFCPGADQPGPSWLRVCCSGVQRWHFPVLSTATRHRKTSRMVLRAPGALGAGAGGAD